MLIERSTNLESCSLSQMFFNSLIDQTLSLLLLKLLVVGSNICLMFVPRIVLFTDRWGVMGQVGIAVVAIVPASKRIEQLNQKNALKRRSAEDGSNK